MEIEGVEQLMQVRGALADAARATGDFGPLYERIAENTRGWIARNFAEEGAELDEFPGGWPPLLTSTWKARERKGVPGKLMLQATGALRRGVHVVVWPAGVLIDNDVPYAARHQLGVGVPRRPFLPGDTDAERIVRDAAEAHVHEALHPFLGP